MGDLPLEGTARNIQGGIMTEQKDTDWTRRMRDAAPDLLEALKEARDHIARSAPDWHYRTQEMLATIDKAIAKAEGKE